jgi:hypothetical protein
MNFSVTCPLRIFKLLLNDPSKDSAFIILAEMGLRLYFLMNGPSVDGRHSLVHPK